MLVLMTSIVIYIRPMIDEYWIEYAMEWWKMKNRIWFASMRYMWCMCNCTVCARCPGDERKKNNIKMAEESIIFNFRYSIWINNYSLLVSIFCCCFLFGQFFHISIVQLQITHIANAFSPHLSLQLKFH